MKLTYEESKEYLNFVGRRLEDPVRGGCYINWTCAGFDVRFTGKILKIRVEAIACANPIGNEEPTEWPWLATIDENGEMLTRFECQGEDNWYILFEAEEEKERTLRILKLNENYRGKIRFIELETDGTFGQAPEVKKPRIEFIGDSITCGYGNEEKEMGEHFKTSTENGYLSFGLQAAKELGFEWSVVSVSGIAVSAGKNPPPFFPKNFAMELQYEYADRHTAELREIENVKWDFEKNPSDYVVINLGTNDAAQVSFSPDPLGMEANYVERYTEFLKTVRRLNPKAYIVSCLGPMNYYLYDTLLNVVKGYKEETGDARITVFKFLPTNMMKEGIGADGHPSYKTDDRMGKELAAKIREVM